MFEQSIVLEHAGARRAGALATSLMAQIAAAGVLIIAPLLYNEVLPSLRPISVLPPYIKLRSVDVVQAASDSRPSQISLTPVRPIFQAPARMNELDTSPTVIRDEGGIPVITGDGGVPGGVDLSGIFSPRDLGRAAPVSIAKPVPIPVKPASKPVQVGGDVQAAKLIRKIVPVYPRTAIIARISGTVRLQGIIGKDGSIQQLQVLSGPPLLINAALDAVRQWRYQPTLLNGEPVEVISPIDVIFHLSQ
jgi:protein TonB